MGNYFKIPLNLPHAGTIATRIQFHLRNVTADPDALSRASALVLLLQPFRDQEENGPADAAKAVCEQAAVLGREIVGHIEREKCGHDKLGQAVRNLFECLTLGEEGAEISLRAGENPRSTLRP